MPHIGSTAHKRPPYKLLQRLWELHSGCLGLLTAQGLAFVITSTLKNICGKPRPDLIARCVPISAASDAIPSGLVSKAICTQQDEGILKDGESRNVHDSHSHHDTHPYEGFLSFPSGHAASAFAGLFYLSLYLAAKLRVADQRGDFWRSFVVLFPTLAAACVAVTRIMDARHHGFDVLFGSALGMFCAWVAYRQYFPPISHTRKRGRAYPMKSWGKPGDRAAPEKAVLADPEKLETAQVAGEYRPTTARGNPFGNSTMTLDDRTLELGHLQLNFSTTDLQDFSGAIIADAEASSDGTSLNSVAIATIERAQYAYTVPTPGLSRTPYPPQNRKPVPAFQSMHRRISSTV